MGMCRDSRPALGLTCWDLDGQGEVAMWLPRGCEAERAEHGTTYSTVPSASRRCCVLPCSRPRRRGQKAQDGPR